MKTMTLCFVPVLAMLMACSTTIDEEESARRESELSCMPAAGTAGWFDKVRECAARATSSGSGSSSSCSNAVACTNGTCKCSDGPNAGSVCDGAATSGAQSCNVLCKVCSSGGTSSGGASSSSGAAPTPPSAPPPSSGTPAPTSVCNDVSCLNGACSCTGGPNKGTTCDGASADGPTACNTLCKYTAEKCEGAAPFIFPF